jgi:hypothetical protein
MIMDVSTVTFGYPFFFVQIFSYSFF